MKSRPNRKPMPQSIKIVQKDETISFEKIRELLAAAHEVNEALGIHYATANQTADELESRLKNQGVCFVALSDDNVIATCSVDFREVHYWCFSGISAHVQMVGVLPEYSGLGLAHRLISQCFVYAEQQGAGVVYASTARENLPMRKVLERMGFLKIDMFKAPKDNFHSFVYMKWLQKCPYRKWFMESRFWLKVCYRKIFS